MRATDLTARSIAASARLLCERTGAARVHAVFERAVYLKTEGGRLLVLGQETVPDGGSVLRVAGTPSWPAITAVEAIARLTPGMISVGGCRIDLRAAALWRTPPVPARAAPDAIERALLTAAWAARTGRSSGLKALAGLGLRSLPAPALDTALLRGAAPHLEALVRALMAADAGAVREPAQRLAGLGPGVTPSGDDVLLGAITGLRYARTGSALRFAIVDAAQPRTTWASAQLLQYAFAGEATVPLLEVAGALVRAVDIPALDPLLARLFSVGETSGADALVGLLAGLAAGLKI